KVKNQSYSPEFRAEAVKLVVEQGLSQEAAAKRLSIPKGTLGNWMAAVKRGGAVAVPGGRGVPELEAENAKLRKELVEVKLQAGARHPKKSHGVLCQGVAAR
ncbi:MAG: transposase, partial [Desulfomicrobium escambiense]|nr:transposase [Desulfomicrobium escambiense]